MLYVCQALLIALAFFYATEPTCLLAAERSVRPTQAQQARALTEHEKFSQALYAYAKQTAHAGTPEYYALVRRGLDRFDAMEAIGPRASSDWRNIDLSQLSSTPDVTDRDAPGQYLTSLHLGIREIDGTRVVGRTAEPVPANLFREVVALTGEGSLCSGIALNATTVLTAAHCACDLRLFQSDGPLRDSVKRIYVGSNITDAGALLFSVNLNGTVFLSDSPPCEGNFLPTLRSGKPDLAIIRPAAGQSMPVPDVTIAPVELLNQSIGLHRATFVVMGFGCREPIQQGTYLSGCKKEKAGVKLTGSIVDSFDCAPGQFRQFGLPQPVCVPGTRELVLADLSSREPADSCGGDSGGPVFLIRPHNGASKAQLVGITSRSLELGGACGFGGIYSKVATAEVIGWLTRILNAPR